MRLEVLIVPMILFGCTEAINYAMTSFFTTGGIRGGKKKMDKFYPRSFNMGVRAEVYKALGGFSAMRFGEDIDFSIRIFKGGYRCRLFPEAWVWHKRRTDLKKFFKQVHNSGIARINLYKKHPGIPEDGASAAGSIYTGRSRAVGGSAFLPVQPAADCVVRTACMHGLHATEQEPAHRCLFHCRRLHPAHRIRDGVPARLVEPLHTWQGRVRGVQKELLQIRRIRG